ncbi:unnamed protein product, partial [Taenia asiatica]|uniref:Ras-associating domain-containing protein n=1 Tax=Taenia asiatica TaxID=60517 RepID=A0A0R3WG04_TAEAS
SHRPKQSSRTIIYDEVVHVDIGARPAPIAGPDRHCEVANDVPHIVDTVNFFMRRDADSPKISVDSVDESYTERMLASYASSKPAGVETLGGSPKVVKANELKKKTICRFCYVLKEDAILAQAVLFTFANAIEDWTDEDLGNIHITLHFEADSGDNAFFTKALLRKAESVEQINCPLSRKVLDDEKDVVHVLVKNYLSAQFGDPAPELCRSNSKPSIRRRCPSSSSSSYFSSVLLFSVIRAVSLRCIGG